jgi:WD40 repeat protein
MPDPTTTPTTAPAESPAPRPVIPGHTLLRRIGQGSYGEVWLGRDEAGAYHAVKVVYRGTFEHDRPFEREFSGIQKFEPVSRTHSSQVGILQVGRNPDAGYFYYVMELADDEVTGQQIQPDGYVPRTIKSELKKRGRLLFQECLDIGLCLTTALEHLHKHGLIHRDIKPSNIIYVNGVPKLADIGLVTDVGATISYVGTEGFLPPEGPVSQQADIYSLGKVLYEAGTGRDRLDFPELPTFLGSHREKDELLELNLVFLRACQNDVRKRYQTAHEMHADLALLQSGRSLRRARALEQRLRNLTRLAVAAALIGCSVAGSYFWISQRRLRESEQRLQMEEREKRMIRRGAEETLDRLVRSYVGFGNQLLQQDDVPGALLWFAEAATQDRNDPTNQQPHRDRILQALAGSPRVWAVFPHRGPVTCAGFSGDGRRILTASADATAQLWDAHTGQPMGPPLEHPSPVACADIGQDGQRVVTACADGKARLWTGVGGEAVAQALDPGEAVRRVLLSPDGRLVLTLGAGQTAKVWNTSGGLLRFALAHPEPLEDAAFSSNSRLIATTSRDRTARIWQADTGDAAGPPLRHDGPVRHVEFSPDGRRLVTVAGGEARVWNVGTGEAATGTLRHEGEVRSAGFSPDGAWVLTAGEDRTARLWDAVTGKPRFAPLPHGGAVSAAAFSPDGRYLATASEERVHLWQATTGQRAGPSFHHNGRLVHVRFNPDGNRILTAGTDGTARLLDIAPGFPVARPGDAVTAEEIARTPGILNPTQAVEAADLGALSQFLAGRRIDTNGQPMALTAQAQRALWEELRRKWPGEFLPAPAAAWHLREAEASEKDHQWFAAVFHWNRALREEPTNATWRSRREAAARRLATSDSSAARPADLAAKIPPRSPGARPQLIDLTDYYNASLTETWLPSKTITTGNDLSALPRGVQRFNGTEFDVRGLIQLAGSGLEEIGGKFPRQVASIRIGRKSRRLHFLFGAVWDTKVRTQIGGYRIHLANGESRESKLIYGDNVREWWSSSPRLQLPGAALAWEGSNAASRELGLVLRLYQMTWLNPAPEVEITALDFFSTLEKPAPFLIAITTE